MNLFGSRSGSGEGKGWDMIQIWMKAELLTHVIFNAFLFIPCCFFEVKFQIGGWVKRAVGSHSELLRW